MILKKNVIVTVAKIIKEHDSFLRRYFGERYATTFIGKTGKISNISIDRRTKKLLYIIDFYGRTGWADNYFERGELRLATPKEIEKFHRNKGIYEAMEVARKI